MRRVGLLAAALSLSACSMGGLFSGGDDEAEVQPSPLVDIINEIELDEVWDNSPGSGLDEQLLRLDLVHLEGQLYTVDREGLVVAQDAETGKVLWEVETELPISAGPGVGIDRVYFATSDAEVVALASRTGETEWTQRVSSEVLAPPVYDAGVVVVRSVDGRITGLDATDGKVLWNYTRDVPALSLRGTSKPVVKQGGVIAGYASGKLVALRLNDGRQIWESSVAIPRGRSELERIVDIDADPLLVGDSIYVTTFQGGLVSLALRSGQIIWRRGELSSVVGMAADILSVFLTDNEGNIWAVGQRDGTVKWGQSSLKNRQPSAPAVDGGLIFIGDLEGYLHVISAEDGHLVARERASSEAIRVAPLVVGDRVYVYDISGEVSAFQISALGE